MPVDQALAHASDTLLFVAVVVYSLAMLAFAAELAGRRRVSRAAVTATTAATTTADAATDAGPRLVGAEELRAAGRVELAAPALVGAAGPAAASLPARPLTTAVTPGAAAGDRAGGARSGPPAADAGWSVGRWRYAGWLGTALTVLGWALHVGSVTTRGLAVHRVPWGNMYEFSSMVALLVVTGFLGLVARRGARWLGVFVLVPVVAYLGLAGTILYVPAGPLVPALQSYWIAIHVSAAITASGAFMLSGIVTVLFLLRARADRLAVAGPPARGGLAGLAARLPAARSLDRTAYGIIAFAFPVWTFAIIAGAIWAESAWGRYWGWDPKETMSLVTWLVYAGYLHARVTAGWAGRRAAAISLVGFTALIVNFYVINYFATGLHEYAR